MSLVLQSSQGGRVLALVLSWGRGLESNRDFYIFFTPVQVSFKLLERESGGFYGFYGCRTDRLRSSCLLDLCPV